MSAPMKRGRKPGQKTGPVPGSLVDRLSRMAVGESFLLERETAAACVTVCQQASAASRFPEAMQGWRFSAKTYTCIGAARMDDIMYAVRIERVE